MYCGFARSNTCNAFSDSRKKSHLFLVYLSCSLDLTGVVWSARVGGWEAL
jgi:hypothetical protein